MAQQNLNTSKAAELNTIAPSTSNEIPKPQADPTKTIILISIVGGSAVIGGLIAKSMGKSIVLGGILGLAAIVGVYVVGMGKAIS